MELLRIIAMLCNLSTGADWKGTLEKLAAEQKECHRYYIDCVQKKDASLIGTTTNHMWDCVKERK